MSDFGDDEYKRMVCVESGAIEKPVTLKPGEEWLGPARAEERSHPVTTAAN